MTPVRHWINTFRRYLTTPVTPSPLGSVPSRKIISLWLAASLLFAFLCGALGLRQALRGEYVVQDDARQHVFWMARFQDPGAFPHDPIADYFQSVAPHGYSFLYRLIAGIRIHPYIFNKLLPLLLGMIATAYCFGLCVEIIPVPAAGFIASLLLNQNLWMGDDLSSATPRAFIFPLLLAFLYYLARGSLLGSIVTIALQGLFYPQALFLSAGVLVLRLFRWQDKRIRLARDRKEVMLSLLGLAMVLVVMVPFAWKSSIFGPTITADEARFLPEFNPQGRAPFFGRNLWAYWVTGSRSGILAQPDELFNPLWLAIGLLLPLLLRSSPRFSLAGQIQKNVHLLPQVVLVSVGMFFAAHALLFKLHLPSRYSKFSFRIVLALAAALALILILDEMLRWAEGASHRWPSSVALAFVGLVGISLFSIPADLKHFPTHLGYIYGQHPGLYKFFARQPKDSLIASLTNEVNHLPTFSQRPILTGREYAIPYHKGYYRQFRQRTVDLIHAQYSSDLGVLQDFIRKYGVTFWLLDRKAFSPEYVLHDRWIKLFQEEAREAAERMKRGVDPALARLVGRCTAFEDTDFIVLDAKCILRAIRKGSMENPERPEMPQPNPGPEGDRSAPRLDPASPDAR